MSSRLTSFARFDESIPEETADITCASCEESIYVGDEVIRTYEADVIHDDCWREYCDMIYREKRGVIDRRGEIE